MAIRGSSVGAGVGKDALKLIASLYRGRKEGQLAARNAQTAEERAAAEQDLRNRELELKELMADIQEGRILSDAEDRKLRSEEAKTERDFKAQQEATKRQWEIEDRDAEEAKKQARIDDLKEVNNRIQGYITAEMGRENPDLDGIKRMQTAIEDNDNEIRTIRGIDERKSTSTDVQGKTQVARDAYQSVIDRGGSPEEAWTAHDRALGIEEETGDLTGKAATLQAYNDAYEQHKKNLEAIDFEIKGYESDIAAIKGAFEDGTYTDENNADKRQQLEETESLLSQRQADRQSEIQRWTGEQRILGSDEAAARGRASVGERNMATVNQLFADARSEGLDLTAEQELALENAARETAGARGYVGNLERMLNAAKNAPEGANPVDYALDEAKFAQYSPGFKTYSRQSKHAVAGLGKDVREAAYEEFDEIIEDPDNIGFDGTLNEKGQVELLDAYQNNGRKKMAASEWEKYQASLYTAQALEKIRTQMTKIHEDDPDAFGRIKSAFQAGSEFLGQVGEADLVAYANELRIISHQYRLATTGMAATEAEMEEFKRMFPDYGASFQLGDARIDGLIRGLMTRARHTFTTTFVGRNWNNKFTVKALNEALTNSQDAKIWADFDAAGEKAEEDTRLNEARDRIANRKRVRAARTQFAGWKEKKYTADKLRASLKEQTPNISDETVDAIIKEYEKY